MRVTAAPSGQTAPTVRAHAEQTFPLALLATEERASEFWQLRAIGADVEHLAILPRLAIAPPERLDSGARAA
jgi:hypothetical protein